MQQPSAGSCARARTASAFARLGAAVATVAIVSALPGVTIAQSADQHLPSETPPPELGRVLADDARAWSGRESAPQPLPELDALMRSAVNDWNTGDLDAFVRPYHDEATFMTGRGPIGKAAMRASYEKKHFVGGRPRQQLAYEQLHTVPVGADAAIMTGRFVLSGGGQPEQSGWFTLVWVRTPAGWKILHDHTS